MLAFIYVDLHEHGIRSDAADTLPRDNQFKLSAEQSETLSGPRHDQCLDLSALRIEFQIHHAPQRSAVRNIDDLLVLQLTEAHPIPAPAISFYIICSCREDGSSAMIFQKSK